MDAGRATGAHDSMAAGVSASGGRSAADVRGFFGGFVAGAAGFAGRDFAVAGFAGRDFAAGGGSVAGAAGLAAGGGLVARATCLVAVLADVVFADCEATGLGTFDVTAGVAVTGRAGCLLVAAAAPVLAAGDVGAAGFGDVGFGDVGFGAAAFPAGVLAADFVGLAPDFGADVAVVGLVVGLALVLPPAAVSGLADGRREAPFLGVTGGGPATAATTARLGSGRGRWAARVTHKGSGSGSRSAVAGSVNTGRVTGHGPGVGASGAGGSGHSAGLG